MFLWWLDLSVFPPYLLPSLPPPFSPLSLSPCSPVLPSFLSPLSLATPSRPVFDGTCSGHVSSKLAGWSRFAYKRQTNAGLGRAYTQVRVFCRVKPHPNPSVAVGPDGLSIRAVGPDTKEQSFSFDRVFGPTISQADVFAEVADLVQSALDGYKVTPSLLLLVCTEPFLHCDCVKALP